MSGTYYLLLQADAYNELGGDGSTNSTSSPLAFSLTARTWLCPVWRLPERRFPDFRST